MHPILSRRDLTGARFGKLIVLARITPYVRPNGEKSARWGCECDCGRIVKVMQSNLIRSRTVGCRWCASREKAKNNPHAFKKGQRAHNAADVLGQKFGLWTVIDGPFPVIFANGKKALEWIARCQCSTEQRMHTGWLKKSGGCIPCTRKRAEDHWLYSGGPLKSEYVKQKAVAEAERGLTWEISYEDFERLIVMRCQYCGQAPQFSSRRAVYRNTLDRLDSLKGYSLENVVPACWPCNRSKHNLSKEEFLSMVDRISAYQKNVGFRESRALLTALKSPGYASSNESCLSERL